MIGVRQPNGYFLDVVISDYMKMEGDSIVINSLLTPNISFRILIYYQSITL